MLCITRKLFINSISSCERYNEDKWQPRQPNDSFSWDYNKIDCSIRNICGVVIVTMARLQFMYINAIRLVFWVMFTYFNKKINQKNAFIQSLIILCISIIAIPCLFCLRCRICNVRIRFTQKFIVKGGRGDGKICWNMQDKKRRLKSQY